MIWGTDSNNWLKKPVTVYLGHLGIPGAHRYVSKHRKSANLWKQPYEVATDHHQHCWVWHCILGSWCWCIFHIWLQRCVGAFRWRLKTSQGEAEPPAPSQPEPSPPAETPGERLIPWSPGIEKPLQYREAMVLGWPCLPWIQHPKISQSRAGPAAFGWVPVRRGLICWHVARKNGVSDWRIMMNHGYILSLQKSAILIKRSKCAWQLGQPLQVPWWGIAARVGPRW